MPGGGVLAAVNGGHNDPGVVALAAQEAARSKHELTLIHVIVVGWDRDLQQSDEVALTESDEVLEHAEGLVRKGDRRPKFKTQVLQARSAGGAIVELGRQIEADLIVVGTRRYVGRDELDLGPTAAHVLQYATCPVVVWHDPMV